MYVCVLSSLPPPLSTDAAQGASPQGRAGGIGVCAGYLESVSAWNRSIQGQVRNGSYLYVASGLHVLCNFMVHLEVFSVECIATDQTTDSFQRPS